MADDLASASVRIDPDLDAFKEELDAELNAAMAGTDKTVKVTVDFDGDAAGFDETVSKVDAEKNAIGDATVKFKGDDSDLEEKEAQASGTVAAFSEESGTAELKADSEVPEKVAEATAEVKAMDGVDGTAHIKANSDELDGELVEDAAKVKAMDDIEGKPKVSLDSSGIDAGAGAAEGAISALIATILALGPAAVAAAGVAAGALAAIPAALGGIATGGIAAYLGLDPVVKALTATNTAGSGAAGGMNQAASAATSLALAQLQAGQTATQSAQSIVTAQQAVVQAQQGVVSATNQVGAAQEAAVQAANGLVQAGEAVIAAQNGVAQAEHNVTTAEEAAAQAAQSVTQAQFQLQQANFSVTTSEESLTQAQYSETQAQVSLTAARQAATFQLQDYSDQLKDGALQAQQDQLNLAQAQQNLTTLIAGGQATPLQIQESQLAIQQATQAIQDQADQYSQLQTTAGEAAAAGVNGATSVVQAQNGVTTSQQAVTNAANGVTVAQNGVTTATQAVTNAQESAANAAYGVTTAQQGVTTASEGVTNAQEAQAAAAYAVTTAAQGQQAAAYGLSQANQSLSNSQTALTQAYANQQIQAQITALTLQQAAAAAAQAGAAGGGAAAGTDALTKALAALPPSGVALVDYIKNKIIPSFHDLSTEVQSAMDPDILSGLQATEPLWGVIGGDIEVAAGGIGKFVDGLGHLLGSSTNVILIRDLLSNTNILMNDLSGAALDLVQAFINVGANAGPIVDALGSGIEDLAQDFANWTSGPGFLDFIDWIQNNGHLIASLISGIAGVVGPLAAAIANLGLKLLEIIDPFLHWLGSILQMNPALDTLVAGVLFGVGAFTLLVKGITGIDGLITKISDAFKILVGWFSSSTAPATDAAAANAKLQASAEAAAPPVTALGGAAETTAGQIDLVTASAGRAAPVLEGLDLPEVQAAVADTGAAAGAAAPELDAYGVSAGTASEAAGALAANAAAAEGAVTALGGDATLAGTQIAGMGTEAEVAAGELESLGGSEAVAGLTAVETAATDAGVALKGVTGAEVAGGLTATGEAAGGAAGGITATSTAAGGLSAVLVPAAIATAGFALGWKLAGDGVFGSAGKALSGVQQFSAGTAQSLQNLPTGSMLQLSTSIDTVSHSLGDLNTANGDNTPAFEMTNAQLLEAAKNTGGLGSTTIDAIKELVNMREAQSNLGTNTKALGDAFGLSGTQLSQFADAAGINLAGKLDPTAIRNFAQAITDSGTKSLLTKSQIDELATEGLAGFNKLGLSVKTTSDNSTQLDDNIQTLTAHYGLSEAAVESLAAAHGIDLNNALSGNTFNAKFWKQAVDDMGTSSDTTGTKVKGFAGVVGTAMGQVADSATTNAPKMSQAVEKAVGDSIASIINASWSSSGATSMTNLKSGVDSTKDSVIQTITQLGTDSNTSFKNSSWSDAGAFAITQTNLGLQNNKKTITDGLTSLGAAAAAAWSATDWKSSGSDATTKLGSGISSSTKPVTDAITGLTGAGQTAAELWATGTGPGTMYQAGHDADAGFAAGIVGNSLAVQIAMHGLIGGVMAMATGPSGINSNSPSKVTAELIGQPIAEGIAVGMTSSGSLQAISNAVGTIIDHTTNSLTGKAKIHSPSQLLSETIGVPLVTGVAAGMTSTTATDSLTAAASSVISTVATGMTSDTSDVTTAADGIVQAALTELQNASSQFNAAGAAGAAAYAAGLAGSTTSGAATATTDTTGAAAAATSSSASGAKWTTTGITTTGTSVAPSSAASAANANQISAQYAAIQDAASKAAAVIAPINAGVTTSLQQLAAQAVKVSSAQQQIASIQALQSAQAATEANDTSVNFGLQTPADKAKDTQIATSLAQAQSAAQAAMSQFQAIGASLTAGIGTGITNPNPTTQMAITSAINNVMSTMAAAAEIQSPSKRAAREIGVPIAQGIAEGLLGETGNTANAASKFMDGAFGKINSSRTGLNTTPGPVVISPTYQMPITIQGNADAATLQQLQTMMESEFKKHDANLLAMVNAR